MTFLDQPIILHISQTYEVTNMALVFINGERVIITNPVDQYYEGKGGIILEEIFRNYLSEYVYVVKIDDGYEVEFSAEEMTAETDFE